MHTLPRAALALALAAAAAAGCGSERAGVRPPRAAPDSAPLSLKASIMAPDEQRDLPNPGTGRADPRLEQALLTGFEGSVPQPGTPGAAVRLPVRDTRSWFISLRQFSSYYDGPGEVCEKWTAGLWRPLITKPGGSAGAQIAVTNLGPAPPTAARPGARARGAAFSEAIVAAPPDVLARLADTRVPAECGRLTAAESSPGAPVAAIEAAPVARLGDGATAFRIVDAEGTASHWVEIVRFPGHLIEIRIPNQAPEPPGDPVERLQRIARAAYARAVRALG